MTCPPKHFDLIWAEVKNFHSWVQLFQLFHLNSHSLGVKLSFFSLNWDLRVEFKRRRVYLSPLRQNPKFLWKVSRKWRFFANSLEFFMSASASWVENTKSSPPPLGLSTLCENNVRYRGKTGEIIYLRNNMTAGVHSERIYGIKPYVITHYWQRLDNGTPLTESFYCSFEWESRKFAHHRSVQ